MFKFSDLDAKEDLLFKLHPCLEFSGARLIADSISVLPLAITDTLAA
jgi:hypothetical protein